MIEKIEGVEALKELEEFWVSTPPPTSTLSLSATLNP
jgi:hypothetical protein